MKTKHNKGEKKYKVLVFCPDCSWGQDPMGCFDGGEEWIFDDEKDVFSTEIKFFNTVKEADDAGYKATANSIHDYKIYNDKDEEIDL